MSQERKPNIVLVYPDQMRYDCMSNSGNTVIKTPGFDRLAEEGVSFTSAYTSYPLCCPFRASLMTGKYAHCNGMYTNHYPIPLGQTFLPELLNEAGYNTGWFGKWHLNGGKKHDFVPKEYRLGFETFVGYSRGHQYLNSIYYRNDDKTPYKSHMFEPDYQTCHMMDFMDECIKKDQPFAAMVCFGPPHPNVNLSPDYYKYMYKPEEILLPDTVPENLQDKSREFLAKYYGLVANVDYQLQRLMNYLEYKGIADNTIFILVSDHGELGGEHGKYAKTSYYESSMHVPFIIRYPDEIKGGQKVGHIVDPSVDLFPTILDLCGAAVPVEAQGHSLKKLMMDGQDDSLNDYAYYEVIKVKDGDEKTPYPERGFRTKDYVYIEKCGVPFALYDLKKDPEEKCNYVNDGWYMDMVNDMHIRLCEYMEKYKDSWDKEAIYPPPDFQSHDEGLKFYNELLKVAVREK